MVGGKRKKGRRGRGGRGEVKGANTVGKGK